MSDWYIQCLQRVVTDLSPFQGGRSIPTNVLDCSVLSLEHVYRELLLWDTSVGLNSRKIQACEEIRMALHSLQNLEERSEAELSSPSITHTGRPRFNIPVSQLRYLVESHFTVSQIASMIGVSVRTIYRRMADNGLSVSEQYSELTDPELDDNIIVRSSKENFLHVEIPKCKGICFIVELGFSNTGFVKVSKGSILLELFHVACIQSEGVCIK